MKGLSILILLLVLAGCGHTQVVTEEKQAVRLQETHETGFQTTKETYYTPEGDIIQTKETYTEYESETEEKEENSSEVETEKTPPTWKTALKRTAVILIILAGIAGLTFLGYRAWRVYQLFKS